MKRMAAILATFSRTAQTMSDYHAALVGEQTSG